MNDMAYIKGILDGDGYIEKRRFGEKSNPRIGLNVKSKTFVTLFAKALERLGLSPKLHERDVSRTFNNHTWKNHMYTVRATCNQSFINALQSLELCKDDSLEWLIGFFQSEGSFRIHKYERRQCWNWNISNNDISKLTLVQSILRDLGIKSGISKPNKRTYYVYVQRRLDIEKLISLGVVKA